MQQKMTIGETIIELPEIDSTNNYAMHLINEGMAEHGMVVSAEFQTKGKGQLGNIWKAEKGKNILCSIIIDTKEFEGNQYFLLNCLACVAVAEILMQDYDIPNVSIKWPNDIYAGKRKVAGILIENTLRGKQWIYSILGIGLNVNQTEFGSLKSATSLKLELGVELNLKDLMSRLFNKISILLNYFLNNNSLILENYNDFLMLKGEEIYFLKNNKKKKGILYKVNENGEIEILVNGIIKNYRHKEIELAL